VSGTRALARAGPCGSCRVELDLSQKIPGRDLCALALENLPQHTARRRRNLHGDLVGLELDQGFVGRDVLAERLQPAQHLRARAFALLRRGAHFK